MHRPCPRPWTPEEREWAQECLDARDSPQEIAAWASRTVVDVLTEFQLAGPLTREQSWRQSVRGERGSHMVGRMLKTAASERRAAGESIDALAAEAGVGYHAMAEAIRKHRQNEKRRLETA